MGKLGAGRVLALTACRTGDVRDRRVRRRRRRRLAAAAAARRAARSRSATTGLDNADPVLFQTIQAIQVFQLVYMPLLTYAHEEGEAGSEIIPGLAEEVPEATNGGKTYEFTAARGPQVQRRHRRQGQRLREHDQAPARSGSVWSSSTARSSRAPRSSRRRATSSGDISGIETNDQTGEITINARPSRTRRSCSRSPSRTRRPTPGGQVAGQEPQAAAARRRPVHPRRRWTSTALYELKRNPNWTDIPGIPKGNFDKITGQRQRQRHEDDSGRDHRRSSTS